MVIFGSIAILVIATTVLVGILLTHTNANGIAQPPSISIKNARALSESGKCLANDVATKTKVQEQPALGEDDGFWTSYIYDVPAGTNVGVSIATYNGSDTVTGSLAYSDNYGNYNFTATKQAGEWRYIDFARCQ